MSKLTTKARAAVPNGQFAFPAQRNALLEDAGHVRNALVRFDHVTGVSDRERRGPAAAIVAALFSTLTLFAIPMPSHATEEPDYQIVRTLDGIEVREYAAYTVAEIVVAGPAGKAGSQSFPILAATSSARQR